MARFWKTRNRRLSLSRPLLMAIVNATPDSFSDGGKIGTPSDAALAALEAIADGADIIDVGGESTRPGAAPVDVVTEAARVVPAIEAIRRVTDAPISVDTRHAAVAEKALAAGADIVNDVSALADAAMAEVVRASGAGLVLMHGYADHAAGAVSGKGGGDAPAEAIAFLRERLGFAEAAGIDRKCLVIDPGIGFAKSVDDNVAVLRALPEFNRLGAPVLVGLSRKRFIGEITHVMEPDARVSGSVAAMLWAVWHGASILRMHDVKAAREAIDIATALA